MDFLSTVKSGPVVAATDGATVTFDLSRSHNWSITPSGNRTFAISNGRSGDKFTILFKQDGSNKRTINWFNGIIWMNGANGIPSWNTNAPTVFSFWYISSSEIYGWQTE